MPAAVPAIIMGGSAIASSLYGGHAANSAAKKAAQRSPAEQRLLNSQTGLADQLRGQSGEMFKQAMPGVQNTLGYYRTLMTGNRGARMAAVSPEAEDVAKAYQGADSSVKRGMVGGQRDQALAENARARAGQTARLITGVRPQAAAAQGDLAGRLLGDSQNAASTAGNIGSGVLSNETSNRQGAFAFGQQAGQNAAGQMGALLAQLMGTFGGAKGGGGTLPSHNLLSSPIGGNAGGLAPSLNY